MATYFGAFALLMSPLLERIYGHNSDINFYAHKKEHSNATIIVHGIAPHENGWSSDFIDRLEARANNQDYYEFTWSGYTFTGTVGINRGTHDVATNNLIRFVQNVQKEGYSKVNIVSHSWGTVLARDAQYAGIGDIDTWVTMGSPLPRTTRRPEKLSSWMNFFSAGDGVVYLGPGLCEIGFASGGGFLWEREGDIEQWGTTGGHGIYWTDPIALGTIGRQLSSQ